MKAKKNRIGGKKKKTENSHFHDDRLISNFLLEQWRTQTLKPLLFLLPLALSYFLPFDRT